MFKALSLSAIVAAKKIVCRDEKQWGSCLTAYANKECTDGCDRTCFNGKSHASEACTPLCYDMIPQPHDKFWQDGITVKSEWPNFMNDGGNTLPSKKESVVNDLYPFKGGANSDFCIEVFTKKLCNTHDVVLTYADESSSHDIVLTGPAYEYCRFSCGQCTQSSGCYETHNFAMQALTKAPDAKTNFNFGNFGDFFGEVKSEVESEAVQVTNEEKEGKSDASATQNENDEAPTPKPTPIMQHDPTMAAFEAFEWTVPNEESFEWDFGGFNSFDWGRKRRSTNLSQAELLKAALENIVSGLSYTSPKFNRVAGLVRKRRQALDQLTVELAEQQVHFDSIETCWMHLDYEEYEDLEEIEDNCEECESEGNDNQYVDRRYIKDNDGMKAYFNSKVNFEEDEMELLNCDYQPMPSIETYSGMDLHYYCTLKCNANKVPRAYNPLAITEDKKEQEADVVLMKCHRTKSMEKKHAMASICNIPSHGEAGLSLICVPDPDAEVEESITSELESDAEILANAESAFADYLESMDYYGY